jgi:hypothetical protein
LSTQPADGIRLVVTRVGEDGRGTVQEKRVQWAQLPSFPMVERAQLSDLETPVRWHLSRLAAGSDVPSHETETIDYVYVLQGELELLVEGKGVRLRAGDCLRQHGVAHGWRVPNDVPAVIAVAMFPTRAGQ